MLCIRTYVLCRLRKGLRPSSSQLASYLLPSFFPSSLRPSVCLYVWTSVLNYSTVDNFRPTTWYSFEILIMDSRSWVEYAHCVTLYFMVVAEFRGSWKQTKRKKGTFKITFDLNLILLSCLVRIFPKRNTYFQIITPNVDLHPVVLDIFSLKWKKHIFYVCYIFSFEKR